MRFLLDGNLLVALVVVDHVHHGVAARWFGRSRAFATCPITQGTLLRLLLREGAPATSALSVLSMVSSHARHEFWEDDVSYADVEMHAVVGHRQVTDAYLAGLARRRSGKLATLDRGVCATHPDVAVGVGPAGEPRGGPRTN